MRAAIDHHAQLLLIGRAAGRGRHRGLDETPIDELAADDGLRFVDQELVNHHPGPCGSDRIDHAAWKREAVDHDGGVRSGPDVVADVRDRSRRVHACALCPPGDDARFGAIVIVVELLQPIAIVLPVKEVEAVPWGEAQMRAQGVLVGAGTRDSHLANP